MQGTIVGMPLSCQATAETPLPSLDRGIRQAKEIEVVARELFTHGPSFVPGSTNRDPVKKTKLTFHPSQIPQRTRPGCVSPVQNPIWDLNSARKQIYLPPGRTVPKKEDLNLVLSFLRARPLEKTGWS